MGKDRYKGYILNESTDMTFWKKQTRTEIRLIVEDGDGGRKLTKGS